MLLHWAEKQQKCLCDSQQVAMHEAVWRSFCVAELHNAIDNSRRPFHTFLDYSTNIKEMCIRDRYNKMARLLIVMISKFKEFGSNLSNQRLSLIHI